MYPISKDACKRIINLSKKDYRNGSSAIDLYIKGKPEYGIKKDLKKAIKLAKYWEKKKDPKIDKYYLVYYNLYNIYQELKKEKLYEHYRLLFCNEAIKRKSEYVYLYCLEDYIYINLKNSINKDKIVNRKTFEEGIKYVDTLLKEYKSGNLKNFSTNTRKILYQIYSTDTYNQKKLYLAHLFSSDYDKDKLIKDFTEEDIYKYIELLGEKNAITSEAKNYLLILRDYKYTKKDDESKCKYAAYYMSKNHFVENDSKKALSLFLEAYSNGYKKAYDYIMKYYKYNGTSKEQIDFLNKHIKKYKEDVSAKLALADAYYEANWNTRSVTDKKQFLKAINIYEENLNNLNDEQFDRLAVTYKNGICVEQDLLKAKQYARSNSIIKDIRRADLQELENIVVANVIYKEEVNDLIKYIYTSDVKKLMMLWYTVLRGYKVKRDNEYILKLSKRIYELSPKVEGPFCMASCYYNNYGVEMDEEKFYNYLNVSLDANFPDAYNLLYLYLYKTNAPKEKVLAALDRAIELGFSVAYHNKAIEYKNGKIIEQSDQKAFEHAKKAYELGHILSANTIGYYYQNGIGVEKDEDIAFKYYLECADKTNHPTACWNVYLSSKQSNYTYLSVEKATEYLIRAGENNYEYAYDYIGDAYRLGIGTKANIKKAFEYYQKGANANNAYCQYRMGVYYKYGEPTIKLEKNIKEAINYFEKSLKGEYYYSAYELGKIYYYSQYKMQNSKKAFENLNLAYEKGIKDGISVLALCYENGYGVKKDSKKALELYKIGYKTNLSKNMADYAAIYLDGLNDLVTPDYNQAIKIYKEIVKKYPDYSEAYLDLGYAYSKIKDLDNAFKNYKLSLKQNPNYDIANFNIGIYYLNGWSVEKDLKKALEYFEKAAKLNYNKAYMSIGDIYRNNKEKYYDLDKAYTYYKKALDAGIEEARGFIADYYVWEKKEYKKAYDILKDSNKESAVEREIYGDLFYNGFYVAKDYNEAFKWYNMALETKSCNSINFKIGRCYHFGHGVEMDKQKAYDYIYLSKNEDYQSAIEFYNEFYKK